MDQPNAHDSPVASSTKTILLAEDDAAHARIIQRAVGQALVDYKVHVVKDGVELLEYLLGFGQYVGSLNPMTPDLILLDLKMPRLGGLDVLQILKRVRHSKKLLLPPIVVLTSSENDADIEESYKLGAHSYLVKPIDNDQFVKTLQQALEYWLELNTPPNREKLHSHTISFPH